MSMIFNPETFKSQGEILAVDDLAFSVLDAARHFKTSPLMLGKAGIAIANEAAGIEDGTGEKCDVMFKTFASIAWRMQYDPFRRGSGPALYEDTALTNNKPLGYGAMKPYALYVHRGRFMMRFPYDYSEDMANMLVACRHFNLSPEALILSGLQVAVAHANAEIDDGVRYTTAFSSDGLIFGSMLRRHDYHHALKNKF